VNPSESDDERSERDGIAQISKALDETLGLLVLGTTVEVIRSEVVIKGSVRQHVVDRGEDGGGHRSPLGSATGPETVELGLQVASFCDWQPRTLDERGFEPRGTYA
jgi:hypothetical protein